MSNPYFRFKQFTIYHDQCAMKVGTDAVLLGAWTDVKDIQTALDVGTGSGLLALMIAQRSQAQVEAVEIDQAAAQQASENVAESPWQQRIQIHHQNIQAYAKDNSKRFDLIISNPPYFINSSKSKTHSKLLARHTDELSQQELLQVADKLLTPNGHLSVIYPCIEAEELIKKAKNFNLFPKRICHVHPNPNKAAHRWMLQLHRKPSPTECSKILIEAEGRHQYSDEYCSLTKDFYLKF